jgi:formate dehydrogenase iron-sulfur subunit
MADKSIFIDTTKCTACRGCQVACKQWNRNPGTKTSQFGSHQNPPDLSFATFKVVRFSEFESEGLPRWYFFPDQCRHCVEPPCLSTAESVGSKAITRDEATGAVLYSSKVKVKPADFKSIRESCPYDIPRRDEKTGIMTKCTLCFDRVKEGLPPACVKTCPTGAMSFGDRKTIVEKAERRLAEVQTRQKEAMLANAGDVRVIYLLADDPKRYHKFAVAENTIGVTRKVALRRFLRPLTRFAERMG